MKKNLLTNLGWLATMLAFAALTSAAQGNFDITFNGGAALTSVLANEQVVGADKQFAGAQNDKIIVATTSPGSYIVRRFHKNTGLPDITFGPGGKKIAVVGGNASAGAITVKSTNEIFVAGQGNSANKCTVVRFQPNGAPFNTVTLTLPSAYSECTITSIKINANKIYLWGTARNSSNKLEFIILRLNLVTFTFDPTWGSGGFVATAIWSNATITKTIGLAFDSTKVYGAGWLNAPGTLSGTAIIGYNLAGSGQVSTGFGDRSPGTSAPGSGTGVYLISGLTAGEMVFFGNKLYLNGNVPSQPAGNFGLVKLSLPATTAGSDVSYPPADLLGFDIGQKLVKDNLNRLISGGRCDIPPTNLIDVGLAKYNSTSALTNTWLPPILRLLKVGFAPLPLSPLQNGDLRRITPGPGLELLLKSLIIQSTNKLVVVAQIYSGGVNKIWIGRILN